ncbi:hypothetical protein CUMW_278940 [Citrus unshiu]|uniref:RRM domain-containing protein n=1 Tax=Citrus unshiu TaxID=55188 RepID=A0A2H5N6S0_CITUN|nr:hypothetical protein CUMW_278940 [Citrus unshiu]
MSGSSNNGCNVYIGNLDEKVSERVLYDILIQAGRVLSGQDKNAQNSSMTTTPLSSRKSRSDPVLMPVNEPPPPGVTLETNG